MAETIKHVEMVPEGVLLEFEDGREALLDPGSMTRCVEQMGGFERMATLRDELRHEADEDETSEE